MGCDYCDSIKGVGPKRAIELIQKNRTIEDTLSSLDKKKFSPPENWPFEDARRLFIEPEVADPEKIEVTFFFHFPADKITLLVLRIIQNEGNTLFIFGH